jgi:hypothetical protein
LILSWTTAHQLLHRAARVQRGQRVLVQAAAGAVLKPTQSRQTPKAASHSRSAFSSIASNTSARSPGEELMTRNTSAVAVC